MPAALHLESGIVGERRLSDGDDSRAARRDFFILVLLFRRNFYEINHSVNFPATASSTVELFSLRV